MLLQAAANYEVETHVLENDDNCPAAHLCRYFVKGDIRDYDSVLNFGKGLDAITIEIENVNIDALEKLENEGVKVYPKPSVLRTIKNKVLQKQFYAATPDSYCSHCRPARPAGKLNSGRTSCRVSKLAEGGYDGRGVQVIETMNELDGIL